MKFITLDDELKSAIQETKVLAKLIKFGCTCLVCSVSNPFIIELHHVGGRKNASFLVPLCANCHVLASKHQLSYDSSWIKENKPDPEKAAYVISDLQFLITRVRRYVNGTN